MRLPRKMMVRSFAVIGFSVALYATLALFFGWENLAKDLQRVSPSTLIGLGVLSLINYGLRFWRWEIYLRALNIDLPKNVSFQLYFAIYVMVITPGKIGEIFKAGILRENYGVPLSRGIPIVLAERIYDFLAVLLLGAIGIFFWSGPLTGLVPGMIAAAVLPLLLFLFRQPMVRQKLISKAAQSPLLAKHRVGVEDSLTSLDRLFTIRQTALSLFLSSVAWLCECLGLWLACRGLSQLVSPGESIFVYAAGTLVGSLSFLPGGLGGTEATLIWLLTHLDISGATAAAVALLVRLFTLWLAVILGLGVFLMARKTLFRNSASARG